MDDEDYLQFIIICLAIGFTLGILKVQIFDNPCHANFKFQVEIDYK